MNKKLLLALFAICFYKINAQVSINNYNYTTSTSASLARSNGSLIDDIDMTSGTTVVLGGSAITNTVSSTANLNFDFYSGGTRFTNFTVTPNGWVGLGGGVSPAILWSAAVFSGTRIAPFLGPLLNTNVPPLSSMTTSSIGRVHYKLIGTSPSRVGVIEFLRMSVNSSVVDDTTTFQVRLYESNGAIEMVYGRMKVTVGAPLDFNIGFKIVAGAHSVNTTTNTSSTVTTNTNTYSSNTYIPNLHNYTNGSQRAYRFTPTPPNDPTNFNISNVTNNSMTLSWTDASNETGYVLYRSIDGGSTYTFVQQFAANAISYNATGLPGGTDVYWRLYSMRESLGTQVDNMATTLSSAVITSVTDGNWNSTTTWSSGTIPTANDSVAISAGDTVIVNVNTATCLRLSVNGALHYTGSSFNNLSIMTDLLVNPGGAIRDFVTTTSTNQLNIGGASTASTTNGSLVNNGTIDIDNGTQGVTFNMFGNGYATITGSPTVFQFRTLQLQKNNLVGNIVEVFTPFSVAITTNVNTLTIQSGTLKLSCAINLTPYGSPTSSVLINSAQGRLWLNHANAVINSTTTTATSSFYQMIGELRIDNGTLNIGAGNAQFLIGTGKILLNNGTINLLGGLQHSSTGTFEMNGGTFNINPINGSTALPNTTAALLFAATSSVIWTGGTINIINPQTLANNVSVNILAGATKTITGGLLKIGNGLQNGTGASNINTAGFGLTSEVPLYDVLLDTRFDLSSGRLVRIIGSFVVGRNLTISTGTSVLPASGAIGGNLILRRQLINNGQVIGNFPILTAPIVGLLTFDGDSSQLISGSGTFSNLANLAINNINGVTSTSSTFGNVVRLNLYTGLLTTNGTLTIGASNSRGTVQVGGINESTPAGSLSSVPLFNLTFTSHRFIYGPTSSTLTTGAFNEMPTGSSATISSLTISDLNGLSSNKTLSILDTLNLGTSNLNINNNNLTIGSSIAQVGRIVRTTGFVQMGSSSIFRRWYATGSVLDNTYTSGFPILLSNQDRSVSLNTDGNTLTTGGSFSVNHANVMGYNDITPSVTDGIVNVNRVSNSYWVLGLSGITVPSFYGLQVNAQMQGVGSVASLNELRLMKPSLGSGNTSTGLGTLTSPIISRLFSQSQVSSGVLNDTFYVGVNNSTNTLTPTYIAIANGSWDDPNTWNNNSVPDISNIVVIPSPYTVNLNTVASNNSADSLAILSGGKLSINTNTLNINRSLLNEGVINLSGGTLNITGGSQAGLTIGVDDTLNVSGGKLIIGNGSTSNRTLTVNGVLNVWDTGKVIMNGNIVFNSGSTFIQTGGDIIIDGNSGIAFTSVLQGKHLLDINTNNVSCSAGNITFVDPPHNSLGALTTYTLRISASSNLSAFSGSHTFIFGDGSSTNAGNTSGFNVDNRKSGIVPVQNIVVNGGAITGRWLSPSYTSGSFGLYALGNLTINSGSEVRQTNASQLVIGGNIINNGTFTSTQTFTVGGLGYTISNAQTISGSGVFRNSTTSTTAEFTTMVVNNGGTTFNLGSSTIRFSAGLNLTSGQVNAGTNVLKIPSTASITRTNGYLTAGALELNFATGTNVSKTYFVGGSNGYTPTILTFPNVTTAGDVRLTLTNSDHPQISSSCIDNSKTINKNWNINNISVLPYLLNADLSYTSADIDAGTAIGSIAGKRYNGSSWSLISLASTSGTNTVINGFNTNGTIQLGELINANLTASVNIAANSNPICGVVNVTFTATPTNGGSSPNYQWKKNGLNVGTNSNTYSDNGLSNNDQITCTLTSNLACLVTPIVNSNVVTMTVNSTTVGGAISGGGTICAGATAGTLTITGLNGSVNSWQSSVAPFSTWTTISNTTNTLSPGTVTQNTKYIATVQNGVCATATADTAYIFINSVSVGGSIIGSTTICSGSPGGTLSLGGQNGNIVRWESSVSPFTSWTNINNTTNSLITGTPTQTIKYRAIVQSGVCAQAISDTATITIVLTSTGGTVSGGSTICSGSNSGTLTLTGNTGSVLNWESSVSPFTSWSNISNTSTAYTSGALSQTTQFRAVVQSGSCASAISSATTVTVNGTTVGGSVTGGSSICEGSNSGILTLSGETGSILRWESSVSPFTTWTTISNTSHFHTSGALTETTQFRAVVQSGTCSASNSGITTVSVSSTSVGGSVIGAATICSGTSGGTLGLFSNNGNVVRWESSVSPFTTWSAIANISNFLILGNLTDSTKYRAVVQNGSCPTDNSSVASIDVTPSVVAGSISGPNNICSGSNPGSLVLTGNVGNVVRWESAVSPFSTFTPISNTTTSYSPGALTQTTQFRAVVQSGACGSATTSALTINISTSVVGGNVSSPFSVVCSGVTPTQSISLTGFSGSVTTWQMATGSSPYTWSNIAGSASLSSITPSSATVVTAYRALVQSGSCGSAVSDSVVIGVNAQSVGGTLSSNSPVCPNSNVTMTLSSNTGNIVRWESAVAPFTSFVTIGSTNNPYTSGIITSTTQYRSVVKSGVCAEATSNPVTVTINNNNTWLGNTSSNWNTASNWSCGVPLSTSDVNINSGTPNSPILSANGSANNISMGNNSNLTVASSGNLSVSDGITLGTSAVFNSSNGAVNFIGSTAQIIPSGTYNQLSVVGSSSKSIAGSVSITSSLDLATVKLVLGNADLTIGAGASVNHSTGYVVTNGTGSYIQNGVGLANNFQMLVGSSTSSYNPITINNAGTTDNFSVRVIDNVYNDYIGQAPSGSAITSNAVDKTWLISEGTIGGSNATVTLQWNSANELTGFTRASSYVAHYNGTTWMASTANAAGGSDPYTSTMNGVTSFSPFGVGSNGTLPVKWIRFNGILANKITNLTWATASEINNRGFEVERSFNGTDFENIGFVKGSGNSNKVNGYQINDNLTNNNNQLLTIYYRLKQIDFDGNFEYSSTITVKDNAVIEFGNEVTITPNPFTNEIQLNFSSANNSTVKLILVDALGREIYSKNLTAITGTNNLVVDDITALKSGVYFARLESNGVITKTIKLLKN